MSNAAFNIAMVLRADVTGAKAGLADITAGLKAVSAETDKTGAATRKETAELERLAQAAGKAALAQEDLARAEQRAQTGRSQTLIAPLANPAASIAPAAAIWRASDTAADSLRASVAGLNVTVGQQAHDMLAASQASSAYRAALDDVRASFNPLFAASRQYEQQLERIAEAERIGAINAHEAAQARAQAASIIAPAGQRGAGMGDAVTYAICAYRCARHP